VKIDRLLSIIFYLLNRDLVSARELAERFGVSVRTIQRGMESIEPAGTRRQPEVFRTVERSRGRSGNTKVGDRWFTPAWPRTGGSAG